jgi:DNA invertase Pin-like site-specific DNA recombinase
MERTIVGYARVSTPADAESSQVLEQQVERLKQEGVTEIFADIESGGAKDRSQFNLMMDLIGSGGVQEVVVTRIDRLTRSLTQFGHFITAVEKSGANLRILDQGLDLRTPTGKLMAHLLGSVAEGERE